MMSLDDQSQCGYSSNWPSEGLELTNNTGAVSRWPLQGSGRWNSCRGPPWNSTILLHGCDWELSLQRRTFSQRAISRRSDPASEVGGHAGRSATRPRVNSRQWTASWETPGRSAIRSTFDTTLQVVRTASAGMSSSAANTFAFRSSIRSASSYTSTSRHITAGCFAARPSRQRHTQRPTSCATDMRQRVIPNAARTSRSLSSVFNAIR